MYVTCESHANMQSDMKIQHFSNHNKSKWKLYGVHFWKNRRFFFWLLGNDEWLIKLSVVLKCCIRTDGEYISDHVSMRNSLSVNAEGITILSR